MNKKKIIKNFFLRKNKICLIEEACDNHFGSLELAKKMIIQSKKAGADVIKFQHHLPDEEMLPQVPRSSNFKMPLYVFLKKYALKLRDHEVLKNFCEKQKIVYLCTPFSLKAVELLEKQHVKLYKIASLENTDVKLIDTIAKTRKPIIISTGASNFKEIKEALKIINRYHNKVIILHCVSQYPTPLNEANLSRIKLLKKKFKNNLIGLSDHTNSIDTSLASVPLGIVAIEKHFKDTKKNKSPDSTFSILPKELEILKKKSIG